MPSEFGKDSHFANETGTKPPENGSQFEGIIFESPVNRINGYRPVKIKLAGNRETLTVVPKDGWNPVTGSYKIRLVKRIVDGHVTDKQTYHGMWTCELEV